MRINRAVAAPVVVRAVTASVVVVLLALAGCAGRPATHPVPPAAGSPNGTATDTGTGSATPTGTRPPVPAPGTGTGGPQGFPAALAGQDIERLPGGAKVMALTFDAGANADGVAAIVATLRQQGVPATFFLTGAFVDAFPAPSRQIATGGYRLGNHSVDHPHFPTLTDGQVKAEVTGAAARIRAVTGADPAPLFRFPFGDRDARTIADVNAVGYLPVRWTVDSLGWQGTVGGTRDAGYTAARVVAAATAGGIVLMHVGSNPDDHSTLDADALPAVIAGLRAKGYGFVSLDALLRG